MARVLLEKATGKHIEYQEHATPGSLINNIRNNPQNTRGLTVDQVEEKEIGVDLTQDEWRAIRERDILGPAQAEAEAKNQARKAKVLKIKTKLGLTDEDWEDLKEALRESPPLQITLTP